MAERGVTHILVLFFSSTSEIAQRKKKRFAVEMYKNFLVRVLGIPMRYQGV